MSAEFVVTSRWLSIVNARAAGGTVCEQMFGRMVGRSEGTGCRGWKWTGTGLTGAQACYLTR